MLSFLLCLIVMCIHSLLVSFLFFFNDTATTEIYTLSLHDALPICDVVVARRRAAVTLDGDLERRVAGGGLLHPHRDPHRLRSEEHTSELQSRQYLVCRLLLEKKKKQDNSHEE